MDQCRLCASTKAEYFVDVFEVRFANGNELRSCIRETTGIEVKENDGVGKHVCTECVRNTVLAYHFRNNAIKIDKQLRLNLCYVQSDQINLSLDPVYDDEDNAISLKANSDDCDIEYNPVKVENIKTESNVASVSTQTEEPHESVQKIISVYPNLKVGAGVLQENLNPSVKLCDEEVYSYFRKMLQEKLEYNKNMGCEPDDSIQMLNHNHIPIETSEIIPAKKMCIAPLEIGGNFYVNDTEVLLEEITPTLSPVIEKSQRIYVCDLCSRIFENKRKYDHHRKKHNVCRHCKTRFKLSVSLKIHLERKCKVLYPKRVMKLCLPRCDEDPRLVEKYWHVFNTENSNDSLLQQLLVQPISTDNKSVDVLQDVLIRSNNQTATIPAGTKTKNANHCFHIENIDNEDPDCTIILASEESHSTNPQTKTNKRSINSNLIPAEVPAACDLSSNVEIITVNDLDYSDSLNVTYTETAESDNDVMEIMDIPSVISIEDDDYDNEVTMNDDLTYEEIQKCKQAFRECLIGKKSDKIVEVSKITMKGRSITFANLYKDLLKYRVAIDFKIQNELDANIIDNPTNVIPPVSFDYGKVPPKEIQIPIVPKLTVIKDALQSNFGNSASLLQQKEYSSTQTNPTPTNGSISAHDSQHVPTDFQQHPNQVPYQSPTLQEPVREQHYDQQYHQSRPPPPYPQFFDTTRQPQIQQSQESLYHMLNINSPILNQSYPCSQQLQIHKQRFEQLRPQVNSFHQQGFSPYPRHQQTSQQHRSSNQHQQPSVPKQHQQPSVPNQHQQPSAPNQLQQPSVPNQHQQPSVPNQYLQSSVPNQHQQPSIPQQQQLKRQSPQMQQQQVLLQQQQQVLQQQQQQVLQRQQHQALQQQQQQQLHHQHLQQLQQQKQSPPLNRLGQVQAALQQIHPQNRIQPHLSNQRSALSALEQLSCTNRHSPSNNNNQKSGFSNSLTSVQPGFSQVSTYNISTNNRIPSSIRQITNITSQQQQQQPTGQTRIVHNTTNIIQHNLTNLVNNSLCNIFNETTPDSQIKLNSVLNNILYSEAVSEL